MLQYQKENPVEQSKEWRTLNKLSPETQNFYRELIEQDCSLNKLEKLIFYLQSIYASLINRKYWHNFDEIDSYCTFIGCGRTGHSLIAALINAHPDLIMSDELNVMTLIENGFSRKRIYALIVEEAKNQNKPGIDGYSYQVPQQWQGKVRNLKVIGDKFATATTAILGNKPYLLNVLAEKLNAQIKFIHVTRNPYDIIKTFTTRESIEIKTAIELYYLACQTIKEVKEIINTHDIIEFKHENFVKNPQQYLRDICHFLEVEATDNYLESCSSIVYKSPHQSRHEIQWDSDSINLVKKLIDEFSFLQGYCFEV
jgi:hypothetical protein